MRAAETAYPVEKHMASVSLVFDDEQNAYLRELSEAMNLDFGLDKLVLDGVNFLPDKAGNCVWVELRTQKTAWMVEARQQLLAALDGIHPGLDVDGFRPHITLGCVEAGTLDDVNTSAIPGQLLVITEPRAAACYNGVHGKVVEAVE